MNKDTLIQLFKAPYNRQAFIDNALLPTFQGKVANLKIYDQQGIQKIDLTASEQNYAVSAVKYGEFQTLDEIPRIVELYEITVNDNKQIERSRVGLGALVKKHIIGNNAVLVNFAYQNPQKRTWRFSFIARDGVFQDGEMQIIDTHPKRYTYVFGETAETYKTALDRFFVLGNELEITINKIKDAFGVEAMSKAFFDEYRDVHYAGFVDYLMRSNFKKSAFNGNDKDIRDFVKKLLGRIVFLYFLQKKGWLGAKDTSYKDGDKNFMTNFFKKSGANDAFYANWLSKLFFDALNNQRPNDDFTMPDNEVVKVPYLNGGLFEKESTKYDFLTFPADLFTNLFEFFDQYNFAIFEDSPEEHTVAVDPEMLGHIFENLLEDNKDKGAFYTPKEIVHYMTQESLIEYLSTCSPPSQEKESVGRGGFSQKNKPEVGQEGFSQNIKLNNLPHLKTFRKELRNNLTPAESKLWTLLKGKQLEGKKFRRQHSVGNYILDFYCPEYKLAIELDGQGHFEATQAEYDRERDLFLQYFGIKVLRFENKWVWDNPEGLLDKVKSELTSPYPLLEKEGSFRARVESFVKKQDSEALTIDEKKAIDQKLDTVKICDPAIGSGAFPMGLLQEIFGLKERIAYDLGYKIWSPATVKGNIIQKSIYGVDIERGAVDIARLRFWLSLIVDEEMPKALPNLDYKIVVGNSLVSKFDNTVIEIDWDRKGSVGEADKHVKGVQTALKRISLKQKQFFESKSNKQKAKLKAEIRNLKLDVLMNQLSFNKATYLNKNQKVGDMGFGLKASDHKKNLEIDLQVAEFNQALAKLKHLKDNPDQAFNHFDWKLDFPEVLNHLVNEATGFDIVIGNPPYVQIKWLSDKDNLKNKNYQSFTASGDIYCLFYEQTDKLLKAKGVGSFITSNKWLRSNYGKGLRQYLINESNPTKLIDFGGNKIFDTATVDTNILFWTKEEYSKTTKSILVDKQFEKRKDLAKYITDKFQPYEFKKDDSWLLLSEFEIELKQKIEFRFRSIRNHNLQLFYGILTGANGTFIINEDTRQRLIQFDVKNNEIIKPIIRGKDLDNYSFKFSNVYLLNTHNGTENTNRIIVPRDYPTLIEYFNEFGDDFKRRGEKGKDWYNLRSCSYLEEFSNPKIIYADIVQDRGKFYFDNEGYYTNDTAFIIVGDYLQYYTLILNSRLFSYFYKKFYSGGGLGEKGLRFKKEFIEKIPVPSISVSKESFYNLILNTIQFIKKTIKKIDTNIPNTHIAEAFEEVIDALVFELYFPEEFAEKGIEIEKYAQEIFKPIEGLNEEEQIKAIQEAYETLREKDNPLRNQIKLMRIELKELLLPILSV